MTTAITTRAAKGSDLEWAEMDANFTNLQATADAAAAVANMAANFDPFRNCIVNGDMAVSQVNGATAVTPASSAYVTDQWKATITQASKLTFQQVADAPAGLKYSTKITVAAAYSPLATDQFTFSQPVEGQNIIDMGFGTAGAAAIAISVYGKASVPGTYACYLQNAAGNRCYVGTINLTNAWTRQTVLLTADTTGSWATDNTAGLWFGVDLGSGTNYNATPGVWGTSGTRTSTTTTFVNQTAGSSLNITGVQIEDIVTGATSASPFEFLPYAEQLRRCQRYLPCWPGVSGGPASVSGICTAATAGIASLVNPVPTRVPLTGMINLTGAINCTDQISFNTPLSTIAFYSSSQNVLVVAWTVPSGVTLGRPAQLNFTSATNLIYGTGAQM